MCEILKVSRRSIQCYEKAGLIKPTTKNKYGYLLYDESTLYRAEKIRYLQQIGFSLKEVGLIIDAPDEVVREALTKKVGELELEQAELEVLIQKTYGYINRLEPEE